jgi:hypothetical protein
MVALLAGAVSGAVADVQVTATPMKPAEERVFDPRKPPGAESDASKPDDLPGPPVDEAGKPLIGPRKTACAVYDFEAEKTGFLFQGDSQTRITITSASVTLAGTTVIHLPIRARRRLIEHERGHDVLARYGYDRIAESEVRKALRGFVGSSFLPRRGKSAKQVAEEIFFGRLAKAGEAIRARINALSDEYDRLTQHGLSRLVDTKTGIKRAKEWFEKGSPDGKRRGKPVLQDRG